MLRTSMLTGLFTMVACVNTTYSRKEEKQITNERVPLIVGQFPHHGKAFYDDQVKRCMEKLVQEPNDVEIRNDLAVAWLKLEQWDKALKEFAAIQAQEPDLYKTHANLGVLYKKRSDFTRAAEHIQKSLEIKPEGHLGLGDYYLRMLQWRRQQLTIDASTHPYRNFLGVPYADGPKATADDPAVNEEYLVTLVKADVDFPDVYLVLGDVYFTQDKLQLAVRAYYRALNRDHPREGWVRERLKQVHERWNELGKGKEGYLVEPEHFVHRRIRDEMEAAVLWVKQFQQTEAEMIQSGQDVDYALVEAEMKSRGTTPPVYIELGLIEGSWDSEWWRLLSSEGIVAILLTAFLAVLLSYVCIKWMRSLNPRLAHR